MLMFFSEALENAIKENETEISIIIQSLFENACDFWLRLGFLKSFLAFQAQIFCKCWAI